MHNSDQEKELAVWRKQATISVQEEFTGKSLPPGLEDSLPTNLNDTFETVRAGVKKSAETYIGLCNLLERLSKRNQGVAADYSRFANTLKSLTEESDSTYATDTNDVPLLNEGIKSTAKHLETSRSLLEDEAHAWDEGVLEDFKRQRDSLIGVRDMFERRDRYARDNIPQLERRIESNESKLMAVRAKPENLVKPGEIEKLEQAIMNVSFAPVAAHHPTSRLLCSHYCRTSNQLWPSTREVFSSKNASATNYSTFNSRSTTLASCIRIGARNASNMRNCKRIIGER